MLRLCSLGVIFTILLAGGVKSSSATTLNVTEGKTFVAFVLPRHSVKTCFLTSPQNQVFEFEPYNRSNSTNKYEVGGEAERIECYVTVHNVDKNDEGLWVMTYDHEEAVNRSVNVNVEEITTEPEVNEDEHITFLSTITYSTRTGLSIDISLDKKSYHEDCYVRPPNGVLKRAEDLMMDGVKIQSSSNFVSCRITIGPMFASLLGEWRLCGQQQNDEDDLRCQPANIIWNNNNNPSHAWATTTQDVFSHPVHYGGSVLSGVSHQGSLETCHVITPNDEDLVITSNVTYPHIERVDSNNPHLCSIKFTNIDGSSIGQWAIYGKFRPILGGLTEIRLPLSFFLYNEEQPYEQAYNVTILPETRHLVILGRSMEISLNSVGQVENCQYRTPMGQSHDLNNAIGPNGVALSRVNTPACRITLDPITEDMVGEWTLIGKFSNGNQFNERRQTFHIIQEDPANPIIDEFRTVENLTELIFDSELGASHRITITNANWVEKESCHLLTPDGMQYAFIDGFHIPNVEILEENGVECGVWVHVETLDMLGKYTLIARATRSLGSATQIERRRPFTIRIEETSSLSNPITISDGSDLYLSLPNATYMYESCKLYGPNDEEVTDVEVDQFRYSSCGFIVRNVTSDQSGIWTIVYGTQIIYRATVEVNILELVDISVDNMVWTAGSSVNVTIGPEEAVYCSLVDNNFNTIFDGFGPCKIELDSVKMAHKGQWRISVGLPGTVMLREKSFDVNVLAADSRPVVSTHVSQNGSSVILTCSVPVENEVQACLFRDPIGIVLIASHGVGQDGFSGAVLRYESDSDSHNCTLRILSPAAVHQGIWRCAVNTAQETGYAFLAVTSSMMGQATSHQTIEPVLRSSAPSYGGADGDAVTMSCSVDASIRYCYYRAPNGTVFNVGPTIASDDFEYVGNGFDAGECGVRFNHLEHNASGEWSCNVGVVGSLEELSTAFDVSIYERMRIWHRWQGSSVGLRFSLGGGPRLQYCRFVRIDGLAFTSENVPYGFSLDASELSFGTCALTISSPMTEDLSPWTVFAMAYGADGELSMTSTFTSPTAECSLLMGTLLWSFFGIMCLLLILVSVSLIPKKNRKWTYERASIIRDSFRKKPLPKQIHNEMLY